MMKSWLQATNIGVDQTYRDDMESFGYVLIDLLKDVLPWGHMTTSVGGGNAPRSDGKNERTDQS